MPQKYYPILTLQQQQKMRNSAVILRAAHKAVKEIIAPGVTTMELDIVAEKVIRDMGGVPAFKGFHGFPSTLCTMINDVVVHGIPDDTPLKNGDLISVDCGVVLDKWYSDAAFSVVVGGGDKNPERERFQRCVYNALQAGCKMAIAGNTLGDIGAAVQTVVENGGYSISRDYTGHGIGRKMHTDPHVFNFKNALNKDVVLRAGMALCIEPIALAGKPKTITLDDGWTVVSADHSDGCQWEHCGIVQADHFEILV